METKPSRKLLDLFSDLAEFDDDKRQQAVVGIVNGFQADDEYCINRLLSGLASSHAAARLGFSCALTLILSAESETWTSGRLFNIIDEKLALEKEVAKELVSRELKIMEQQTSLGMAICDSIARLALQADESLFVVSVWDQVKKFVTGPLISILPEWLYFILLVVEKFSVSFEL
ncbi:unnamed protein product [Enterobius vermicularis]|uniref:Protein VAC14-like protein n=1 Tax=Enterobius vermicularis TaxID=51028 RepID=A0A0N4UXX4_ENTVE|nr:unnamed protein product [Enterobius vermicularis]